MKRRLVIPLMLLVGALRAEGIDFRHIGDFIIQSRVKISGDQVVPTTIKPLRLSAFTDGITVRLSTEGADEASEYRIYCSEGIGRQQNIGGALEIVPGVQALSEQGGMLRQLRLTQDTITITTFPGQSDQTVILSGNVAPPPRAIPAEESETATVSTDDAH